MTDIEEQIADLLGSAQHAPMSTHDPLTGSCSECPWPLHYLPPAEIAVALMPLVKRAQAEALREHGRVIAYWERGNSSRVLRYSVDRLVADLNERADQIEKEAGA